MCVMCEGFSVCVGCVCGVRVVCVFRVAVCVVCFLVFLLVGVGMCNECLGVSVCGVCVGCVCVGYA